MDTFVEFTTYQTFPLHVDVFDANNMFQSSYTAPAGFVFYKYFQHLHANNCVVLSKFEGEFQKYHIYTSHSGPLLEIHVAKYLK